MLDIVDGLFNAYYFSAVTVFTQKHLYVTFIRDTTVFKKRHLFKKLANQQRGRVTATERP
jgi:hypothetical protein